jgi:hypothetical protein
MLTESWGPAIAASEEAWGAVPADQLVSALSVLRRVRDASLEKLGYRAEDIFALGPSSEHE